MRLRIALLAALLPASIASGHEPDRAAPPPALTREEARTLPPSEVADIVLRQVAGEVREITRPDYDSQLMPNLPMSVLAFATAPRSSGYVGLCTATEIQVSFFGRRDSPPRERNLAVRARNVSTEARYKVIGEVALASALDEDAYIAQDAACARLTQVVPPDDETIAQRSFFTFSGDLGAAQGVAVLQWMLSELRSGRYTQHRCERTYNGCTDSGPILRALSFDDLLRLEVHRAPLDPTSYAVTGTFVVSGEGGFMVFDEVQVEATFEHPWPRLPTALGPTSVRRASIIRD